MSDFDDIMAELDAEDEAEGGNAETPAAPVSDGSDLQSHMPETPASVAADDVTTQKTPKRSALDAGLDWIRGLMPENGGVKLDPGSDSTDPSHSAAYFAAESNPWTAGAGAPGESLDTLNGLAAGAVNEIVPGVGTKGAVRFLTEDRNETDLGLPVQNAYMQWDADAQKNSPIAYAIGSGVTSALHPVNKLLAPLRAASGDGIVKGVGKIIGNAATEGAYGAASSAGHQYGDTGHAKLSDAEFDGAIAGLTSLLGGTAGMTMERYGARGTTPDAMTLKDLEQREMRLKSVGFPDADIDALKQDPTKFRNISDEANRLAGEFDDRFLGSYTPRDMWLVSERAAQQNAASKDALAQQIAAAGGTARPGQVAEGLMDFADERFSVGGPNSNPKIDTLRSLADEYDDYARQHHQEFGDDVYRQPPGQLVPPGVPTNAAPPTAAATNLPPPPLPAGPPPVAASPTPPPPAPSGPRPSARFTPPPPVPPPMPPRPSARAAVGPSDPVGALAALSPEQMDRELAERTGAWNGAFDDLDSRMAEQTQAWDAANGLGAPPPPDMPPPARPSDRFLPEPDYLPPTPSARYNPATNSAAQGLPPPPLPAGPPPLPPNGNAAAGLPPPAAGVPQAAVPPNPAISALAAAGQPMAPIQGPPQLVQPHGPPQLMPQREIPGVPTDEVPFMQMNRERVDVGKDLPIGVPPTERNEFRRLEYSLLNDAQQEGANRAGPGFGDQWAQLKMQEGLQRPIAEAGYMHRSGRPWLDRGDLIASGIGAGALAGNHARDENSTGWGDAGMGALGMGLGYGASRFLGSHGPSIAANFLSKNTEEMLSRLGQKTSQFPTGSLAGSLRDDFTEAPTTSLDQPESPDGYAPGQLLGRHTAAAMRANSSLFMPWAEDFQRAQTDDKRAAVVERLLRTDNARFQPVYDFINSQTNIATSDPGGP